MDLKPMTRKEFFLQKIIDNTAMGGVTINNQDKTITENGTYTADEGFTGLGTVTVDVQSGGDEASVLDSLIDRSITEVSSNVERIGVSAFWECKSLITADFPLATIIGASAFDYCSQLATVNFPLATEIGNFSFRYCLQITKVCFPLATKIGNNAFDHDSQLTTADFTLVKSIGSEAFRYSNITALILRNETMATISNKSAFNVTPIANGTGHIYVPKALMESYQSATNWATYATQFRAIEDYSVDGTVTGELDWAKIEAAA